MNIYVHKITYFQCYPSVFRGVSFFFLAFVFSACEIPKYGTETCRYVRDLETSSKLGKSVYVSLEFRTWGRKSMLSVPYELAEACCPVNAPAGGCSFDGLQ